MKLESKWNGVGDCVLRFDRLIDGKKELEFEL